MHYKIRKAGALLAFLMLGILAPVVGMAQGNAVSNSDAQLYDIELAELPGTVEPSEGNPSPSVSEQPAQSDPEEHSKWLAVGVASGVALVCIIAISMVEMLRK